MPIMLSGVEGIRACLGFHLGHSDWLEVDRVTIERFESLTDELSRSHIGEDIVPCGVMVALLIPMLEEIYVLEDTLNVALHRIEQLQFVAPAPTGSGLRVGATVRAVQPVGDHWHLNLECAMECDALAQPVLRANVTYRFRSASVAGMPHLSLCRPDLSCR
ncbi:hypothetical protein AWB80_06547 [Caballeronia pedi]|uniref:Uncharacterized protein n=2 Tax=Caballeronia pedi TaxID=1777141 RepID=A0A158D9Q3_9BURK|nr:hypothetical protein AWB80_06547 [Caballeronia pedi]